MRRRLNVRLLAIVLGSLTLFAIGVHLLHAYQLQQNAYRLLERGNRAMEEKDYEKALLSFGQYLAFVPNDPDTLQRYTQALDIRARTPSERVRLVLLMEQVLRAKPNERDLRFRLINNLILLHRFSEAIDHLRRLANQWPDKAEAWHMLGWCQEAKEDYLHAVESFEKAIALDPKRIETYALLIQVLSERRNLMDEAQKRADDMVLANPDSYRAYLVRANFQRRRGEDAAADRDLEAAFTRAPDQPEVILALADAARARGNWERAAKLLQDGLKTHPNQADFYNLMVGLKLESGQRIEAIDIARESLVNVPGSTELTVLLIDLLIDEKQYDEARKKIDVMVQTGTRTLPNYLNARLLIADGKWAEALPVLEDVARDLNSASNWSGRVHALRGLCYRQLGDQEHELQAYRNAVAAEPGWPAAHLGLATALLGAGRAEEAVQTLETTRGRSKLPPEYWTLLARSRLAQQANLPPKEQRWDKVEEALAKAPANERTAMTRAAFLTATNRPTEAKALLVQACTDHPHDVAIRIALAELAWVNGQGDDAVKSLDIAVRELGDVLDLRLARGRLWAGQGSPLDRANLARLGDSIPASYRIDERVRLQRELADHWHRLGEPKRAEQQLRRVAAALPRDLPSRLALMDLALEQRQVAVARVWLDEIRAIEGEKGLHWRTGAIALQLLDARKDRGQLDDVRRKLTDLKKFNLHSPRLALLSAVAYELEGQAPKAIPEYMNALALGDTKPSTLARLVQLLLERREFTAAEAEISKYERKAPLPAALARVGAEVALQLRDEHFAKVAIDRAERAVTLPARDYRDALWLAHVYQEAGAAPKAERLLETCIEQAGYVPDVWVAWMKFLTATERRDRAAQELVRMAEALPKERLPLTQARCLDALHQHEPASTAYREALRDRPNDFILLGYAADFFDRADQSAEAMRLYNRLLELAPLTPADLALQARRRLAVLGAAQNSTAARQHALALLDGIQNPTLADERIRWYVQGFASKTARREAIDKFQKSLTQSPLTPDERVLCADLLEAAGLPNQASAHLVEVIAEQPNTPHFLARYVHALIRAGDLDEAERQLGRLAKLESTSERVRALRAELAKSAS